ncbi:Two-component system yycF/yycG regulatory protein yycH [Chlamydia abortus]|nr:two-component system activity regulator YycH [Aneurinibacillus sp. XH2]SHE15078.1 Two-component system yycF/yycG regulatory protein yycH [Chlamydia abortus]
MMEKAKTVALVVLVAASLVQSYLLAYSSPNYEPINQMEYVDSGLDGPPAALADLILPEQMIIHFGNKQHTVLPYGHQFYNMVYSDLLKQRSFENLRRTNLPASYLDWDLIRDTRPGIEIRFKEAVPIGTLKSIMKIKEDFTVEDVGISKIWIYESKEEVKTYFLSDSPEIVYEAVQSDLTVKELENKIGLGAHLPAYYPDSRHDYYLPAVDLQMVQYKVPFNIFTEDQLKRSLFPDPGMARFLFERDGAQIYTDGKRGLQVRNGDHWFSYSDPVSVPVESRAETKENLTNAVKFINRHGGWNSDYLFSRVSPNYAFGPQTFEFRQYVGGYPVMNTEQSSFGYIKIVMQKGVISNYERSMINMDIGLAEKSAYRLPGGDALATMLEQSGLNPVAVYPAYQATLGDEKIHLVPQWAVELQDGTYRFLKEPMSEELAGS